MRATRFLCGPAALALFMALGCGGAGKVKVEGIVTLDDQVLAGATVQFIPKEGSTGHPASGLTGSDGHFTLTTHTSGDGVEPGEYEVLITKTEAPASSGVGSGSREDLKKTMMEQMNPGAAKSKKKVAVVPESYGLHGKSGLKCTVPTTGVVTFSLRSTGGT